MTRQDTRKDTDQKSKRPLCTHACRSRRPGTVTATLLVLVLALLVRPTRTLADGPAPSRQATAEVVEDMGKVAPKDGLDEALESNVAPETDGALVADQDGESPDQVPDQEESAAPKDTAKETSPEASQPQSQASAGETSTASVESTSGETTGTKTSTTQEETPRVPDAAYTVATNPVTALAIWATHHPVGTCLATGAVALLVFSAFHARTGQQNHQEKTVPSYRRHYHYIL